MQGDRRGRDYQVQLPGKSGKTDVNILYCGLLKSSPCVSGRLEQDNFDEREFKVTDGGPVARQTRVPEGESGNWTEKNAEIISSCCASLANPLAEMGMESNIRDCGQIKTMH